MENIQKDNKKYCVIAEFLFTLIIFSMFAGINIQNNNNSNLSGQDRIGSNSIHNTNPTPYWNFTSSNYMLRVSMSSNGSYIAAGGFNHKIYLFHNSSAIPLWEYTAAEYITSIAISSDGNYIIASTKPAGNYAWAYLFHKSNSTPLWSFSTNTDWIRHVAISANGSYVVVVSDRVFMFEKSSSTPLWVYATGGLNSLAISDDGNYIVAGGGYPLTHVYFFHRSSSTPLWTHSCPQVWSAAISSDGKYIVSGDSGGNVTLFEKSNSTPLWTYSSNNDIWSVAISKDGKYIGAGNQDGYVYFFENSSSTPLWSYKTGDLVRSIELSDNGEYIFVGSEDFNVYFFGASSNMTFWSYETGGNILSGDISSKGNYSVVGSFDFNLYYFYQSNDNSPPSISNPTLNNDPLPLGDNQTLTFNISDNTGVLSASIDIESPDENILSTLDLYDDGTHGDIISGDGTFTTTWNSLGYSEGTYNIDIKAVDSSSPRNDVNIDNILSFTVQDMSNPLITDTPSDFVLEFGYTGVNISWIASDENPNTYTIELQGTGIVKGPTAWASGILILYNVPNGLAVGTYIYIVNFTDGASHSATDTVTMTVEDTTDPIIIDSLSNFTVDYGYTGVNITWTATDPHPNTYTIELQGTGIVKGPTAWLNDVEIRYNIPDNLAAGDYIYTIKFTDDYDNFITDSITLTVREEPADGDPSETISFGMSFLISIFGSTIILAVAIFVHIRNRQGNIEV